VLKFACEQAGFGLDGTLGDASYAKRALIQFFGCVSGVCLCARSVALENHANPPGPLWRRRWVTRILTNPI